MANGIGDLWGVSQKLRTIFRKIGIKFLKNLKKISKKIEPHTCIMDGRLHISTRGFSVGGIGGSDFPFRNVVFKVASFLYIGRLDIILVFFQTWLDTTIYIRNVLRTR